MAAKLINNNNIRKKNAKKIIISTEKHWAQ